MLIWQGTVVMTAMAMAAYARVVTEYIPGSGCGTANTIRMLKRDPTVQELSNGCIYVMKDVSSFDSTLGNIYKMSKNICSDVLL